MSALVKARDPLLVEIGCEEIPARSLEQAREDLARELASALSDARLLPEGTAPPQAYSTPRRLVAWVPEVLGRQPDTAEEVLGPPVRVALDEGGKPTRAAESFAQKNQVRPSDLVKVSTPKGEYMAVRRKIRGRPARALLPEVLRGVLARLAFRKSMYWMAQAGPRFIRPIRWLLALLGEGERARVIPLEFAGVRAGNLSHGHRALGRGAIAVESFKDYAKKLRRNYVEFDPETRRQYVRNESNVLLADSDASFLEDKGLEDWIVNSTECPQPILGGFDKRFLHLPREILVTVMRDQQKYFAVEDRRGRLVPHFIAVMNLDRDRAGWVRAGHERVLAARFRDAEFFWDADQRLRLEDRHAVLARVTYGAELGSYAQKVERMVALAGKICEALEAEGQQVPTEAALRAARLAKCDLTTQMVKEFPELQGIVGGLYARAQGEAKEVADAIYDHYRPQGLEDPSPRTLAGAIISLADKLDTVVAGFAVGQEPTGSSDPFALRRQGNGIIKVLLAFSFPLRLRALVEEGVQGLEVEWRRPQHEVFSALVEFFEDRLRYTLETVRQIRYDTLRAVLAAGWDVPLDVLRRADALEKIRGSENLEALSIAAKRIKNILTKSASANDWARGEVEPSLLAEKPEKDLYRDFEGVAQEAARLGAAGDYRKALEAIAGLRAPVDVFFDKVLVMAEDSGLRENRLRLLAKLHELFTGIAHFAELAPEK